MVQSGTSGESMTFSPYSAQGLLGDNQIGAIADSGLDIGSCYFNDPRVVQVYDDIKTPDITSQPGSRKVIQYTFSDSGDITDVIAGHGTHASGTMLGSVVNSDLTTPSKFT